MSNNKVLKIGDEFEYPAIVISGYGEKGDLWIVNFVGLTSCWVEGTDREDVLRRAPSVLSAFVRGCLEAQWYIPEPPSVAELKEANIGEVITVKCVI